METCRVVGAPEAVSNLLGFPHRLISSTVIRIGTRYYLNEIESKIKTNESIKNLCPNLNHLFSKFVETNDDFTLPESSTHLNHGTSMTETPPDKHVQEYFDRPDKLYDCSRSMCISTKCMNMVTYIENYEVTRKRKTGERDFFNKKAK